MSFKRFGDWLLTENGKKFSFVIASTVSVGVLSFKFLPNTLFLEKYKDVVHLYRHGLSVPLSEELKKRFEKAIDLVQIGETEKKLFKPFAVFGFDTFHAGTSYSKFGAIIGIPVNFTYKDVESIDKNLIKVNNESIPWDLEEASQLLDSFVLSENAQLYAIAREIVTANSAKLIYDTLFAVIAVTSCYGFSNLFNIKLNMYAKPRSLRIILYTLITAFAWGNYVFAKDVTQTYYERDVDKFLKEKDLAFAEGGKEYYVKILQRNRALRKLLGKAGESHYSALGNENFFIRQKHIPLVHRKEFFEQKLIN